MLLCRKPLRIGWNIGFCDRPIFQRNRCSYSRSFGSQVREVASRHPKDLEVLASNHFPTLFVRCGAQSQTGVHFTNILREAFLYESVMCSFSVLTQFLFVFFGKNKLAKKLLMKMLMKLTPGWPGPRSRSWSIPGWIPTRTLRCRPWDRRWSFQSPPSIWQHHPRSKLAPDEVTVLIWQTCRLLQMISLKRKSFKDYSLILN